MSDSPQLPGPFSLSARLRDAQAIAGTSRHYQGPGLGVPPPWDCPTCGRQWSSDPATRKRYEALIGDVESLRLSVGPPSPVREVH